MGLAAYPLLPDVRGADERPALLLADLVPERCQELEDRLVEAKWKDDKDYAGYSLLVSYLQLAEDFEWLDSELS